MKIKCPYLAVDIIIEFRGGIVLIERKNPPYGWALPGGFVEYGESLEDAARREAKEETSLDVELLEQFYTYSDPVRDPRFHVVSTVFIGLGSGELKPKDDARKAGIFREEDLPSPLAFDHLSIIKDYINYKKTGRRPHIKGTRCK